MAIAARLLISDDFFLRCVRECFGRCQANSDPRERPGAGGNGMQRDIGQRISLGF